jgi:hypothetical protein
MENRAEVGPTEADRVSLSLSPVPPESGANQRTFFLWKALSEIAPVDVVLCHEMAFESRAAELTMPGGVSLLGEFLWRSKQEPVRRLMNFTECALSVRHRLFVFGQSPMP